jgi:hypothetical protein
MGAMQSTSPRLQHPINRCPADLVPPRNVFSGGRVVFLNKPGQGYRPRSPLPAFTGRRRIATIFVSWQSGLGVMAMDDQEASDSGRSQVVGRTGEERGASFRSQAASRRTAVDTGATALFQAGLLRHSPGFVIHQLAAYCGNWSPYRRITKP